MFRKENMLSKQAFLEQLAELVSIRSISGDQAVNAQALDYIESLLAPTAKVQRIRNKSTEILLASNHNQGQAEIGYLVHVDVVAGSDQLFNMRQEGSKVFGRGVSDMKFSIPLGVALLNELIKQKSPTTFTLAITTDEELGGFDGASYLANELQWHPQVMIVPDGGDNLKFVSKSKGVAGFEIIAQGVSAHASRPWKGKSALVPLCQLVVEIEKRYGQTNQKENNWKTTVNYGYLRGGESTNQVCDQASLFLDFRYPETDSDQRIEQELRVLIQQIDSTLKLSMPDNGLPTFTDANLPVVKQFLKCMEATTKQKIIIQGNFGASDARHFTPYNIPILMIKPKGGDIHCATEFLNVESTMQFYQGLRKFLDL